MKYLLVIILFAVLITPFFTAAQRVSQNSSSFEDRIFTGGSLGLQFGTYTLVDVEPIFGYKVTEQFAAGLGITYVYLKYKDPNPNYSYSTNIYGGSIFTRYYITENIFAHVEYEVLNLEVPNSTYYDSFHRQNVTAVFLGGGYREAISDRSSVYILFLYDINHDINSPFENPIIKVGLGIGI